MSATSSSGSEAPAMRRPSTIDATSGTASRPAPGIAVFEKPTTKAAIAPMTIASAVNTTGDLTAATYLYRCLREPVRDRPHRGRRLRVGRVDPHQHRVAARRRHV